MNPSNISRTGDRRIPGRYPAIGSFLPFVFFVLCFMLLISPLHSQGTRLLRQPSIAGTQVTFTYGSDIWISDLDGGNTERITSTAAVESNPHFSPDGKWIAFNSNRSGNQAVYVVSAE